MGRMRPQPESAHDRHPLGTNRRLGHRVSEDTEPARILRGPPQPATDCRRRRQEANSRLPRPEAPPHLGACSECDITGVESRVSLGVLSHSVLKSALPMNLPFGTGRDAFHCVPNWRPEHRDAVERVPTRLKGSMRELVRRIPSQGGFRALTQDSEVVGTPQVGRFRFLRRFSV
jgi:hypothetical protein